MDVLFVLLIFAVAAIIVLWQAAKVVPQQQVWVIERLGRYNQTLRAGLNVIVPFLDRVRDRQDLRETVVAIDAQECITKDNVRITVDGVLFYQIVDPVKATYGIAPELHGKRDSGMAFGIAGMGPRSGIIQLAQTTVRSEIGKIELDRTFEERPMINAHIVSEIDKASAAWGIKVLRYEIKNITPPADLREAMERQMLAERQKRAAILISEGERTAAINASEGSRAAAINASEGNRQAMINNAEGEKQKKIKEAEGQAAAITAVANATADGIRAVAQALQSPGGFEALQYRVATHYIDQFGLLARETNTMILPTNFADVAGVLATAMSVIRHKNADGGAPGFTASTPTPTTPLPRS